MQIPRNFFTGLSRIFGTDKPNLADLLNGKPDRADLDEIDPIEDPAEATAEEIATKVNEIIAALKTPAPTSPEE